MKRIILIPSYGRAPLPCASSGSNASLAFLGGHRTHRTTIDGAAGNMVVLGFDLGSGPFITVAQVGTTFYGTQQMALRAD